MSHPTKLTLRLDSGLIESAKAFAAEHGRSVSQLVADYFARLAAQPGPTLTDETVKEKGTGEDKTSTSITASLRGSWAVKKPAALSPITDSLRGVLKGKSAPEPGVDADLDPDKAAYHKYLEEKYL